MDKIISTIETRRQFVEIVKNFDRKISSTMSMTKKTRQEIRKICEREGLLTGNSEKSMNVSFNRLLDFYEDLRKGNDTRLYRAGTKSGSGRSVNKDCPSVAFQYKKVVTKLSEFTAKDVASTILDMLSTDEKTYKILEKHNMTRGQYDTFVRELYNDGTLCGVRVVNYNNLGKPDTKTDLFRFARGNKLAVERSDEQRYLYEKKLAVLLMRIKHNLLMITTRA